MRKIDVIDKYAFFQKYSFVEFVYVYFLLSVFIIAFNFPDIFLLKTMVEDDNHRYIIGLDDGVFDLIFIRNTVRAYVLAPLFKLMTINLMCARLAETLFFYIPLAFSIYCLIRFNTKLPAQVAFFSSLLPCILPGQTEIPAFIDGSYTVQGLLVFSLFLHVSIHFLGRDYFSWSWFVASVLLYGVSLEMMDHSVFLAPFAMAIFFFSAGPGKVDKRKLWLALMVLVLALAKSIQILRFPTIPSSIPKKLTFVDMIERLTSFATETLPFSHTLVSGFVDGEILWIIFICIVIVAMICASGAERRLIILSLFWSVLSSVVFLTMSRYYSPRVAHIPGFGINFAIVVSVFVIIRYIHADRALIAATIVFSLLASYSGVSRIKVMVDKIKQGNKTHYSVVEKLHSINIPDKSQIVILNAWELGTKGLWGYSSGYLKYATGRTDVTGLAGPELNFYDPFQLKMRGYTKINRMKGISLEEPIFLYRVNDNYNRTLEQMEYMLQWAAASWQLYQLDLYDGSREKIFSGSGHEQLNHFLQKENISRTRVAFAQGMPGTATLP